MSKQKPVLPPPDDHEGAAPHTRDLTLEEEAAIFAPGADDYAAVEHTLAFDVAPVADDLRVGDEDLGDGSAGDTLRHTPPPPSKFSMVHDRYDEMAYQQVLEDNPTFAKELADMQTPWPFPAELSQDLYAALYRMTPREVPPERFDQRYQINRVATRAVLETDEYKDLHDSCLMDEFASALGIEVLMEEILKNTEMMQLAKEVAEGQPPEQGESESDAEYAARKQQWQQERSRKQRQLSRQAREALDKAREQLGLANDAVEALDPTWSQGDPGMQFGFTGNAKEKAALVRKVLENEHLRQIVQFAGRFKRIATEAQKLRTIYTPDEVYSLTKGNDLARLLPSEYLTLTDDETVDLFLVRYVTRDLLLFDLSHPAKEGQGPIIVAQDESGSMSGTPDAWAKAAFLALFGIAQQQQRDIYFMHFSDMHMLQVRAFRWATRTVEEFAVVNQKPHGKVTTRAFSSDVLMETVLHFYGSGTDFDPWMLEAIKAVKQSEWERADIIVLSDGAAYCEDKVLKTWQQVKQEKQFRCYGILVSNSGDAGQLDVVCDLTTQLRFSWMGNAEHDQTVLTEIFSV